MREGRQNLDTMELYQCLMEINAHFRSVVLYCIELESLSNSRTGRKDLSPGVCGVGPKVWDGSMGLLGVAWYAKLHPWDALSERGRARDQAYF